jgi:hypothetical protein
MEWIPKPQTIEGKKCWGINFSITLKINKK